PLPEGVMDMAELSRKGIVDAAFPGFIHGAVFEVWVVTREDYARVSSQINQYTSVEAKTGR
ncbi:MAG TPA: hypothetical protein VIW72_07190, partial [Burkholderiales bacterium]